MACCRNRAFHIIKVISRCRGNNVLSCVFQMLFVREALGWSKVIYKWDTYRFEKGGSKTPLVNGFWPNVKPFRCHEYNPPLFTGAKMLCWSFGCVVGLSCCWLCLNLLAGFFHWIHPVAFSVLLHQCAFAFFCLLSNIVDGGGVEMGVISVWG